MNRNLLSVLATGVTLFFISCSGNEQVQQEPAVTEELVQAEAETPSAEVTEEAAPADTFTTESGLKYVILKEGEGAVPAYGQTVSVNYTGYFLDGKKFDSSFDRNQPLEFTLGAGQVIKGWDEGVALMQTGSKMRFIIPHQLAYGEQGYPGVIPPASTLVFDVELLGVK